MHPTDPPDVEEDDEEDGWGAATGSPMKRKTTSTTALLLYLTVAVLGLAALLTLTGCVQKAIVVDPIAPAVTEAKGKAKATSAAAKKTTAGATETVKLVVAVGEGIDEAISHADHVRSNKAPGSQEADEWMQQWQLLTDLKTRNLFAESSASSTVTQSAEAQALADDAEKGMDTLEDKAKATDKNTTDLTVENTKLAPAAAAWNNLKMTVKVIIGFVAFGAIAIGAIKLLAFLRP